MTDVKDFILAIENLKIDILKKSDEFYDYELSGIKRHARGLYETLVWLQYEAWKFNKELEDET